MVDHFEGEDVIITFERNAAATVTNVTGKVQSINISGGEENTEVRYAFGNKQILFGKPKEKFKIDMDVLIDSTSASAIFTQAFFGGTSITAGTVLKSSSVSDLWRIICWFVPYSSHTTAGLPPLTDPDSKVMVFIDCKSVSFEKKFESDDMLVGTISFELSATDSDGYANYHEYYTNSTTSTLLQLTSAYANEYRGTLTWTTAAFTGAYST